jgi:hypothetical protein
LRVNVSKVSNVAQRQGGRAEAHEQQRRPWQAQQAAKCAGKAVLLQACKCLSGTMSVLRLHFTLANYQASRQPVVVGKGYARGDTRCRGAEETRHLPERRPGPQAPTPGRRRRPARPAAPQSALSSPPPVHGNESLQFSRSDQGRSRLAPTLPKMQCRSQHKGAVPASRSCQQLG